MLLKRKNKHLKPKTKVTKLLVIILLVITIFLTVGFSALNGSMEISDLSLKVRAVVDVRIKNIEFLSSNSGGVSLNDDYNIANINGTVTLPNADSYVDYRVTVANLGNVEEGIAKIIGDNENLTYELIGDYALEDKICDDTNTCKLGITDQIDIRIKWADGKYDASNSTQAFSYDFDFEAFNSVIVDSSISSLITNCPDEIITNGTLVFNYSGDIDSLIVTVGGVQITSYTYDSTAKTVTLSNVTGVVYIKAKSNVNYLGKAVDYLDKTWYVLSQNDSTTTLIAAFGQFDNMASCVNGSVSSSYCYWASSSSSSQYQWSKSQSVDYLNNTWLATVDGSDIIATEICDDTYSNGGPHLNDGTTCTNGYVTSKVRFISSDELTEAISATGTNTSWLYGTSAYNALGAQYSFETNFVSTTGTIVSARGIDSSGGSYNADHATPIRPVITIPTTVFKNLLTKTITYEDIMETNLPTTIELGEDLVISFTNSYYNISVYIDGTKTTDYTYENNILTLKDVSGNVTIKASGLEVGDPVTYLSKDWFVLATDETAGTITLIADYAEFDDMASCVSSVSTSYCYWASRSSSVEYKWSKSQVVDYLNNTWLATVDGSDIIATEICDDTYSNGGPHLNDGTTCTNGYVTSKVRFISQAEFTTAKSEAGTNTAWLYGTSAYNALGAQYTFETNFISTSGTFVAARSINSGGSYNADHATPIRPVITVPESALNK